MRLVQRTAACVGMASAALLAASPAGAASGTMITGAGFTTNSGFVVLHARATEAMDGDGTASATGFIKVRGSSFAQADFTGTVTCIGSPAGPASDVRVVSGVLSTPFVADGQVFPNFTFLIQPYPTAWYALFIDRLGFLGPCGESLFFAAGLPNDGHTDIAGFMLQRGNFVSH